MRELTTADGAAITAWYERTIGYVPNSVEFAMKYHPEFYKWHRARWEVIFQTLPKQVAPYVMLRQHMLTGNKDALREAVLLGKAWGITSEWTVHGLMASALYTGFEGLYIAHDAGRRRARRAGTRRDPADVTPRPTSRRSPDFSPEATAAVRRGAPRARAARSTAAGA